MLLPLLVATAFAAPSATGEAPAPPAQSSTTPVPHIGEHFPGVARCGGTAVTAVHLEAPMLSTRSLAPGTRALPRSFAFSINAEGRPVDIREIDSDLPGAGWVRLSDPDVAAALAVSRFRAGRAAADCRITYQVALTPYTAAVPAQIARFTVEPHARGPETRAMFERMHGPQSSCISPPPEVRLRAYPPFRDIAGLPGSWAYAMIQFDIDRRGRPRKVTLLSDNATPEQRAAALAAVRASRFAPSARRGCTYPYYFTGATLPAPERPDRAAFQAPDARCEGGETWQSLGRLSFPPGFERRGVEGWALVRYDLSPAGVPTAVEAVASSPAAAFGSQAEALVRAGRQPAQAERRTGCLEWVVFRMPGGAEAPRD